MASSPTVAEGCRESRHPTAASPPTVPPPVWQPAWDTRGRISRTAIDDDRLVLRGTIAAPRGTSVRALRVFFGSEWVVDAPVDVVSADQRGDASFLITIPGRDLEARLARTLVTVVPLGAGDEEGARMLALPRPAIARPDRHDASVVFSNRSPTAHDLALLGGWWSRSTDYLACFIDRACLRPDEQVCEIGCGMGRMANALAHYLERSGSYHGFDVGSQPVRWAREHVSRSFPRFHFDWVDAHNELYNPRGTTAAVPFPWPSAAFDFAYLTSVFTHMLAPDIRHYLRELHRVLRRGGRCACSWYLLNEASRDAMARGTSRNQFTHPVEDGASEARLAEQLIAFDQDAVLRWVGEAGFDVVAVHSGAWTGESACVGLQDILILSAR
jgi:SAM-dependent methyltransferase